jgi:catechol 2,3-dioxygenase-like lactoylglutathione lyase family enzyme
MSCCSPQSTKLASQRENSAVIPPITEAKAHLHVQSADFRAAVAFYRAFFGAEPVKLKPGYAKFLPDWAPVNLAISEHATAAGGGVSHVGIQLPSAEAVQDHLARVRAAGLPVRVEMGETCCYANQDKFWVTDPAGLAWEVYYLNFDVTGDEATSCATTVCCPA